MNNQIINELKTSPFFMTKTGMSEMEAALHAAHQPFMATPLFDPDSVPTDRDSLLNLFNRSGFIPGDGTAIISITGMMTKYARYDFSMDELDFIIPGMDDIAALLEFYMKLDECKRVILVMNTPGGTTQSLLRIEEVLLKRTKPIIAVVDGMCASAGMYVASLCDRIVALNKMCSVGSIGVMVQLVDDTKMVEAAGLKIIEIYPPESADKNKAYRDAINGETQTIIDEVLTPLALHFQEVVRTHRPQLKEDDGVLTGKMFYAPQAVEKGLIDDIQSFAEV